MQCVSRIAEQPVVRLIQQLLEVRQIRRAVAATFTASKEQIVGKPFTIVVLMCENIFSERVIRVWNSLPSSIVSFKSLLSFRNSLGDVNLGVYTKY